MHRRYSAFRSPFLTVSIGLAFGLAGSFVVPASAQQSSKAQQPSHTLEEITVTGTRIVSPNATANSPIVTINAQQLESQAGINLESYLNQLPNFNPAASPTTTNNDVQVTPVNSVGIASISLRGFGPNRNLVLVNGHRTVPVNALMVTDINSIPSAMIQRVETITGGASAVYGADAVSGVTNFILRDRFQGFRFDAQDSVTAAGDGQESRISALAGTDFANDKGNITFAIEEYNRKGAKEVNRKFYLNGWADPTTPSGNLFVYGYNGYNTGFDVPAQAALNGVIKPPAGTGVLPTTFGGLLSGLRFNSDGTMFDLSGNNLGSYKGPINGREYARMNAYDTTISQQGQEVQTLKWNNPQAYVSSPQERYSAMGSAHYDFSDKLSFFSRLTFAQNKTRTLLIPTNASFGWEADIPYNPTTDSPVDPTLDYTNPSVVNAVLANPANFPNPSFIGHGQPQAQHPVPVDLAVLLNSRPFPGPWIAETYPLHSFPQRSTVDTANVWQLETGLDYNVFKNWTGEFYVSHGESSDYNLAYGDNSLARWRGMVTAPDYGYNATLQSNSNGASPGFGSNPVHCTTGFYNTLFHGDAVPSADCQYAVEAILQTHTHNAQDIVEVNMQGPLAHMRGGDLRTAVGLQYRKNTSQFTPDILQSTASFTDQVIGVYPTSYLNAQTSVMDYYGELRVPFAKKFQLNPGFRYSKYDTHRREWTYKLMANVEPNSWLRFRGGYNRATRAPNLGELYLNTQQIFRIGGANFGDPCGLRSNAPFGAGGVLPDPVLQPGEPQTHLASGQTMAGAMSTYLICKAQMGAAGASTFYGANATGATGSQYNWVLQKGNPKLDSEKADTYTLGMVVASPSQRPGLAGLSGSIDYWRIDLKHAIEPYSIDYARYLCYGTATVTSAAQAAQQAATPACQNVSRNQGTGGPQTILLQYSNQATLKDAGIDLDVNWRAQFADLGFERLQGGIGINVTSTWLDYFKTKQSPANFDVTTNWKGSLGPNLAGTNAGAYSYRLITTFSYYRHNLNLSLRWRHLPGVWSAAYASQQAVIQNDQQVAGGAPGVLLDYTPSSALKTSSYDALDLSFNLNVNSKFSVRGGIDNLLDTNPARTGKTSGYPSSVYTLAQRNAICGGAPGCQNPTDYSLPVDGAGQTNAGYYDVLGRRYFVGLTIHF